MIEDDKKKIIDEPFPFSLLSCTMGVADARTPVFERNDYEFCTIEYVVRGSGVVAYEGEEEILCEKDSVYFLHHHSNHRYWPIRENPWHKIFFVVDGALADYLFKIYKIDQERVIQDVPALFQYFEAMNHLVFGSATLDQQAAVIFHQFLEACSAIINEPEEVLRPEITALKNMLDQSIEKRFNLEEFSQKQGVSSAHLIRNFRKKFDCAPYEYLMRQRIEVAKRLLMYSNLSIKEIAEKLVFSDQYYFSGTFKRRTSASPSAFRRSHKDSKLKRD